MSSDEGLTKLDELGCSGHKKIRCVSIVGTNTAGEERWERFG